MKENKVIRIENEGKLVATLENDIIHCPKNEIVFMAGHFPMLYDAQARQIRADVNAWGPFPTFSLELAARLAKFAKKRGIKPSFLVVADDHTYNNVKNTDSWISKVRQQFYEQFSGKGAKLPEAFSKILAEQGFSEAEVIRQDHGKKGREDCLLHSENVLIRNIKERLGDSLDPNYCAKAYREITENPAILDKMRQYLMSFVPNRCSQNVCSRVLDKTEGLDATHIFTSTEELFVVDNPRKPTREELFTDDVLGGVWYRKDMADSNKNYRD